MKNIKGLWLLVVLGCDGYAHSVDAYPFDPTRH